MICPCCKQSKEQKDFYWRGTWLVHKECRTCQAEIRKAKREELNNKRADLFDVDLFAKQMLFQ